jgi:hypothetical protein
VAGCDDYPTPLIITHMNARTTGWLLAVAAAGPLAAQGTSDTGFAAMQRRGAMVMGVDQYTSHHTFDLLPDGGRIVLVRAATDTAGVRTIRAHMQAIATAFAAGDFEHALQVHQHDLPGAAVMRQRRGAIHYVVDTLPGGGAVRISSTDTVAVRAIHEFLSAQRMEHQH